MYIYIYKEIVKYMYKYIYIYIQGPALFYAGVIHISKFRIIGITY